MLREVFIRVLRLSPPLKKRHFQIQIRSGTHGLVSASSYELLKALWVNRLQITKLQTDNFLESDPFFQDDGLSQFTQTGGRRKDQFRRERGKDQQGVEGRRGCSVGSPAQINETCRSYDYLDFGDKEGTDPNRLDRWNQGRYGDNNRGRGHRGMRQAQGLSSKIVNQGTLTGGNEEDSNFEPNRLLVCGLSESTTHDGVLNFIEVISGEEVQKVQISKGKALVTMTKDITSK